MCEADHLYLYMHGAAEHLRLQGWLPRAKKKREDNRLTTTRATANNQQRTTQGACKAERAARANLPIHSSQPVRLHSTERKAACSANQPAASEAVAFIASKHRRTGGKHS